MSRISEFADACSKKTVGTLHCSTWHGSIGEDISIWKAMVFWVVEIGMNEEGPATEFFPAPSLTPEEAMALAMGHVTCLQAYEKGYVHLYSLFSDGTYLEVLCLEKYRGGDHIAVTLLPESDDDE